MCLHAHLCQHFWSLLVMITTLTRVRWKRKAVLICVSKMAKDTLNNAYSSFVFLLLRIVRSLAHVLIGSFCFPVFYFYGSLYILDRSPVKVSTPLWRRSVCSVACCLAVKLLCRPVFVMKFMVDYSLS